MTPEQRYCFDLSGYLHLRDVVTGQDLQEAQEAADRYIRMPPEEWPPGFGADLERKDVTGYQNGFAFDKSLEQLALHPTTWPILMEFTNYRPRFTSGTLGYNHHRHWFHPLHAGWTPDKRPDIRRYFIEGGKIRCTDFIFFFYLSDVFPGDGGLIVLFQKQWVENEKLTFPLAQMPLDLTRGIDAARRVPEIFRTSAFWAGFAVVFLAILYNIGTYFAPGLPPLEVFGKSYDLRFSENIVFDIRVLPLVLALTYLCPVDILGSLIVFHWLAVLKRALMTRMGFALDGFGAGAGAGSAEPLKIIFMESYGALIFIGVWSVWLARRHLRQVWQQVRSGRGDPGEVRRYRVVLAGLVLSGAWVVGWGVGLGMSLPLAIGSFTLMVLTYFVTAKLVAATGFAYLLPNKPQVKGNSFIIDLIGSIHLSPRSLVAYKIFTSNAFFGTFRIPAWPALPHCLRLFSLRQPGRLTTAVLAAFLVGFLVAALATIELAYDGGGHLFLGGKANWVFEDTVHLMNNPVHPALGKWGVWLFGFTEAALIAVLRGYFHWFPLHPIGLAFQNTFGVRLYWFSLFIVWVVKLTLLRYGEVKAFRTGKPFFYGLAIGYVVGVILSNMVDLIWFPAKGHHVHGW